MSSLINHRRESALPGLWHDYANLFPMLDAAGQDALRADVQVHGVREAVIQFEGRILDGRNRYMAARDLGLDFPVAEFVGTPAEALAYVLSTNLHRRHLTESQRAAVAAKLANMKRTDTLVQNRSANLQNGEPSVTQARAAEMLNVSERSVATAKKVIEQGAPELVDAVERGVASISAAADLAALPADEQAATVSEGSKAIKVKAREVREARATLNPSAEPVDPAEAKMRRELRAMTADGLIDEVIGLRRAVDERRSKEAALKAENADLKTRLKEATAADQGAVIGSLQRELRSVKKTRDDAMSETKRMERRMNKALARVKELEAMPISMDDAA